MIWLSVCQGGRFGLGARPHFSMKTLLVVIGLLLVSPLAAQTRAELDSKYGPIEGNLYRIKPGIAVQVAFSESDEVESFRIVSDDPKDKNALLRVEDVRKVVGNL